MSKKYLSLLLTLVLMLSFFAFSPAVASAESQNLIVNGSFELNGSVTSASVTGWTVTNLLEINAAPTSLGGDTYFAAAAHGRYFAELNSIYGKPATITQKFNTTPGTELTVKFALSNRNSYCGQTGASDLTVSLGNGATVGRSNYSARFTKSTNPGCWAYNSFKYVVPACQTTTFITFSSNNGNCTSLGNDIDDVSVVSTTPVVVCDAVVTTGNATEITASSAKIVNNTYVYGGQIIEAGVRYSLSSTMSNSVTAPASLSSPFTATLSPLKASTTYYYQAYVRQACGKYAYGQVKYFTTTCPPVTTTILSKDFEDCTYAPFARWGNVSASIVSGMGVNGSRAAKLCGSTGGFEYVLAVKPNTTYTFSAYCRVDCGQARLGIKNSHEVYETVYADCKYSKKTVSYTTGATGGTLVFYYYLPAGCSNIAYLDNVLITATQSNCIVEN